MCQRVSSSVTGVSEDGKYVRLLSEGPSSVPPFFSPFCGSQEGPLEENAKLHDFFPLTFHSSFLGNGHDRYHHSSHPLIRRQPLRL